MGEGFVVLSSNTIDFYYYMDEPGIVPEVPLMIELANGDVVECHAPVWGLDIHCGKGTDFSYGPWADRKREQLFKFFYPPNYQPMKVIRSFIKIICSLCNDNYGLIIGYFLSVARRKKSCSVF